MSRRDGASDAHPAGGVTKPTVTVVNVTSPGTRVWRSDEVHRGGGERHAGTGPDRKVAELASRQRGVVSRAQLLAAGLTERQIDGRLARGSLHRIHRGVYFVGHPVPVSLGPQMAALLAAGPGAVLSHRSAAELHGLLPPLPETAIDVTVPTQRRRRRGVRVHRHRLVTSEMTHRAGLPVTTVARTLRDLASFLSEHELERAAAEAEVRGLIVAADLCSGPGSGSRRLDAVLQAGPALTRSEAERRLLALVRGARLPPPRVNSRVGRYEVDFCWSDHRLIVEVDGFAYHGSRAAFERDRIRDADLQEAGYRVLRLTWHQLTAEPIRVVARLARTLSRPPTPAPP